MKWSGVRLFRLELPLAQPIPVRGQRLTSRQVLRIECETKSVDGTPKILIADCAPLPYLHDETFEICLELAIQNFSNTQFSKPLPVSLQTAFDILDWQNSFGDSFPPLPHTHNLFENVALLSRPSRPEEFAPLLSSVREARVCKVKIPGDEMSLSRDFLLSLVQDRPDRELRVDCNQAFEGREISEILTFLADIPLAYIEEPLAEIQSLKELAKILPIALDESLGRDAELDAAAKAWIIKPNVLGWYPSLKRFQDQGPQQKVLSNCFESYEMLQLYAWAYAQNVAHPKACGLGTAFYFKEPPAPNVWPSTVYSSAWPSAPYAASRLRGELLWSL